MAGAALVLAGCGTSTKVPSSVGTNGPEPTASITAPTTSSFKNGVLTTPDIRIKILRYKIIAPGQKGNDYGDKTLIAFWYTITNISGQTVDPISGFIGEIEAYQDNNPNRENKLNVGVLPDDQFLDTQMDNVKKGGTVENAVSYELTDLKTPVDLVASNDLGQTTIGKVIYRIK